MLGNSDFAFTKAKTNSLAKDPVTDEVLWSNFKKGNELQTNLLLVEAAARGWVAGGNAAAALFFTTGIKAHMEQMAAYDASSTILAADRDTYAAANPLDVSSLTASFAQIGYQYWIASFLHGPEAWANFRRTGFPVLAANPYTGSEVPGGFINRITYPPSEILVNSTNEAITAQGVDNLATKVWWNK